MGPEKRFENKIKKELRALGVWYVKYFGCDMSTAGVPDLLCCVNGHFVALEIKAEKGRLSEIQKYQIDKIKNAGGVAMAVYPDDFEALIELLKKLKDN